ncbi:integrase [Flavobacterium faecale]|uniref:Integrase n=1 Tax=Flavobacterium faecale TaxID=1355330 RepID=A0A2S1LGV8_9FLAO|nr:tyrosine-type recombinase/integrase [Flavobacterium faecale]AWG22938.1 integrase [Flavobacterium faecale]
MKYTFTLKQPNADSETLIYFTCYFNKENKRFIFSTGESIHPDNWDFENKFPFTIGKKKSKFAESIKMQLDRHSNLFNETESLYKRIKEDFTSKTLRNVFDTEFKVAIKGKNIFFDAYDVFMAEKKASLQWSAGTVKRYNNIKNTLKEFETAKKYELTFSRIDLNFYGKFASYCMEDRKQINNTYLKNLGFFKTFMFWAVKNKYTYNTTFENFNHDDNGKCIIKPTLTKQIALTIEDLNNLMQFEFKTAKLEKVRDVFVFQCVTGMRFGEIATITKSNVTEKDIILKEEKDEAKAQREIPLTNISRYILTKYDYQLPLITNQKQNEYIKDVFEEMKYSKLVQKVTVKGKDSIKVDMNFYDRISTHTARRTFITMMKREGKSDKLIASMTGHTDMKTLNAYYQVDAPDKQEAMDEVFNIEIPLRKAK